ncbi:MAG: HAD family hydrolase [Thermoanaerobaculia bacterium]
MPIPPPEFRVVVFDLDGTLIDSYAAIHESLNTVLKDFGREPVSLRAIRGMVGRGLESLIASVLPPEDLDAGIELFRDSYATTGPELTELLPGADRVTRVLHERDIALFVVSNKPSDFSEQLLDHLRIGSRFELVLGPDQGFLPKPSPEMLQAVLDDLEEDAQHVLYVGDMPLDVESARAAGMPVAVVPTGSASRKELEEARPDFLLEKLVDLLELVATPSH